MGFTPGQYVKATDADHIETDGGAIEDLLQVKYNPARFDKDDSELADIPGMLADVEAGGVYSLRATLPVYLEAGGGQVAIGGTATATSFSYQLLGIDASGSPFIIQVYEKMAMFGAGASLGGIENDGFVTIDGVIVVDTGGTLTVQFAQGVTDATPSAVYALGTFEVKRIKEA